MNILYETEKLRLESSYEDVFLTDKETGRTIFIEDCYGDPICGFIDEEHAWAAVGGKYLTIWTPQATTRLEHQELAWIFAIRAKGTDYIEVLTDPWSEDASVWQIDMRTYEHRKLRDFDLYKDRPYTEKVVW